MIPPRLEELFAEGSPAQSLGDLFDRAGYQLYLVGGSVRDAFLGVPTKDLDFATDARPDTIVDLVEDWADAVFRVGEQFGTIGATHRGQVHEITTFRSDVYREDSRKPRVEFSDDIETDLSRRDFTVNAMAVRLTGGGLPEMVDPFQGLADLAAQVLRTPMEPEVSFGDDPLRMLRLYRFAATLGFQPEAEAEEAVFRMRERLEIISAERIRDELSKLIVGTHVENGLWGLVRSRLADEFLPELTALELEQDPVHNHKDVLAHTIAVVSKTSPDEVLRLAALFHDVGKPATREFGEQGVTFHHHEVVGARMTRQRMRQLRFPKDTIREVAQLVFLHMRPHTYKMGWTDSAVRRYVRDAGVLLPRLNELVRSDVTTRSRKRANAIARRLDELEERIGELRKQEELDALRPPIDGHDVMAHLQIPAGPAVGEAMRVLTEHRIEYGPYEPEVAYRLLDEWWRSRSEG
ncbi:MAG: CCA tRNA nucleotidyltransferase [Acidimicrobiia bacterium]|nr:CCA tRNA nucleotidyltransferase [Acidimicrobiia bacterium]